VSDDTLVRAIVCPGCGYDLRAWVPAQVRELPVLIRCSECGESVRIGLHAERELDMLRDQFGSGPRVQRGRLAIVIVLVLMFATSAVLIFAWLARP
jgi:DNA-directed RNA polymerase subunit RPC12/RpoP